MGSKKEDLLGHTEPLEVFTITLRPSVGTRWFNYTLVLTPNFNMNPSVNSTTNLIQILISSFPYILFLSE